MVPRLGVGSTVRGSGPNRARPQEETRWAVDPSLVPSPKPYRGRRGDGRDGSMEVPCSFQNCTQTMNQDGIALSQRDRAHLSWEQAQSGGPRRAATRCAEFGDSWRGAKTRSRFGTLNRDGPRRVLAAHRRRLEARGRDGCWDRRSPSFIDHTFLAQTREFRRHIGAFEKAQPSLELNR
jgi:hypothetical protein